MTYYRDTLTAIESRLAEIQAHLEQMPQMEGAQDESSAALERVEEAFALIEDARNQMAAQPAAAPAVPAEPADAEPDTEDGDGN